MNDMGVTMANSDTAGKNRLHSLSAADRREITVQGVSEVLSFDDAVVRLVTVCGILNLEGEGLRVHVLNLKEGVVVVTGRLNGVLYEDAPSEEPDPRGKARGRRLFR